MHNPFSSLVCKMVSGIGRPLLDRARGLVGGQIYRNREAGIVDLSGGWLYAPSIQHGLQGRETFRKRLESVNFCVVDIMRLFSSHVSIAVGSLILGIANVTDAAGISKQLDGRELKTTNDETRIIRGHVPRRDGLSYQYENMKTPLRGNIIFSDILLPSDLWYGWNGKLTSRFDVSKQTPENYHESHNHYQSLLSEVINATPGANAIPIWGDAVAAVNGANVWGGFFSARSSCNGADLFGKYIPKELNRACGPDYDAQLTGLEVDVLNAGKPGIYPNKAKHGVQIVGFGNPNGQALSIIAENFDRAPEYRRGQFESILYAQNSLQPAYGRFIVMDFDQASIGLDMRKPLFLHGAMVFRTEGVGTGVQLNQGRSGELYGGPRWPSFEDKNEWLSARIGTGGFRLVTNNNMREALVVDNHGGIYLNGDVYLNGEKLISINGQSQGVFITWQSLLLTGGLLLLVLVGLNVLLVRHMVKNAVAKNI